MHNRNSIEMLLFLHFLRSELILICAKNTTGFIPSNSSENMFKGLLEDLGVLIIVSSLLISLITADDVDSQTSYVPDLHLD